MSDYSSEYVCDLEVSVVRASDLLPPVAAGTRIPHTPLSLLAVLCRLSTRSLPSYLLLSLFFLAV